MFFISKTKNTFIDFQIVALKITVFIPEKVLFFTFFTPKNKHFFAFSVPERKNSRIFFEIYSLFSYAK